MLSEVFDENELLQVNSPPPPLEAKEPSYTAKHVHLHVMLLREATQRQRIEIFSGHPRAYINLIYYYTHDYEGNSCNLQEEFFCKVRRDNTMNNLVIQFKFSPNGPWYTIGDMEMDEIDDEDIYEQFIDKVDMLLRYGERKQNSSKVDEGVNLHHNSTSPIVTKEEKRTNTERRKSTTSLPIEKNISKTNSVSYYDMSLLYRFLCILSKIYPKEFTMKRVNETISNGMYILSPCHNHRLLYLASKQRDLKQSLSMILDLFNSDLVLSYLYHTFTVHSDDYTEFNISDNDTSRYEMVLYQIHRRLFELVKIMYSKYEKEESSFEPS